MSSSFKIGTFMFRLLWKWPYQSVWRYDRCYSKYHKPYIDSVAGRNALEIVLAIYKSAATGEPVKLPL